MPQYALGEMMESNLNTALKETSNLNQKLISTVKTTSNHLIKAKIVQTKEELQKVWETVGCTDEKVLALSIKVDFFINQYQIIKLKQLIAQGKQVKHQTVSLEL